MFTTKRVPFHIVFPFTWRAVLLFIVYSTLFCPFSLLAAYQLLIVLL
jgi:putative membrane protein